MNERIAKTPRRIVLLSAFVVTAALLKGCSSSDEPQPPPPPPPAVFSVLVSPATLNGWVTSGYGTDENGYSKMVVLDVAATTGTTNYTSPGHVPGAFQVNSATEVTTSRDDGMGGSYSYTDASSTTYTAINAITEVATAAMMNAVIQRTGIDANTVVVLTGDSLMNAAMAYFDFRYWGFPKERLRVLDRTNAAYVTAGYTLETSTPTLPTPSTYGVCDLVPNISLRATLADMIRLAEGTVPNALAWDVRKPTEYAGNAAQTSGPLAGKPGYAKYTAFEGRIRGAVNLEYNAPVLLTGSGSTMGDVDSIKAALAGIGVSEDVTTYVYCRTAGRASISFLMLDGMLGYPARMYDASWIEWGNMADVAKSGGLAADSPWRTDRPDRSEAVNYNVDNATEVDVLLGADSYAAGTDLITMTDLLVCGG